MYLKDFWFSYKNILLRDIERRKYLTFFRRIFGILLRFLIRSFKHKFNLKVVDLDKFRNQKEYLSFNLEKLFFNFNSDKGSHWFWKNKKLDAHNYSEFYEKYFSSLKKKKINFLEIGSHEGKGVASFFFYFPFSRIIGANINPFQMKFSSKRITELYIDVSSKKILNNFANHLNEKQDIILDDASHNIRDILITLSSMFKKLKSGGIYVIEDIEQFKIFNELNPYLNESSPMEILKKIKDKSFFKSSFIEDEEKKYLIDNIETINFEKGSMIINGQNASDIAFIFKR